MALGRLGRCFVLAGVAMGCCGRVLAADPTAPAIKEIREFEVLLRGRPVGTTTFAIEPLANGRTRVTIDAAVRVNIIVYGYKYDFHGTETWLGGQLESFQCHGSDGGTAFAVQGTTGPSGALMVINGKQTKVQPFAAAGNFWRMPQRPLSGPLTNVDASTGKLQQVLIADGKPGQVPLGQTQIPARQYELTGDVDVKLWLDQHGLIVRQISVEQGYPTELRLTNIRRVAAPAAGQPGLSADQRTAIPAGAGAR